MSKLIVNEIEKYDAGQLTITTGTDVSIGSNLTVGGAITGDLTGDVTGTVLTAAQANITSVGTLSGLTLSGGLNGTTSVFTGNVSTSGIYIGRTTNGQAFGCGNGIDSDIGIFVQTNNILFTNTGPASSISFATASSTRMTITPTGNVGIGQSSPTTRLEVYSGTLTEQKLLSDSSNGIARLIFSNDNLVYGNVLTTSWSAVLGTGGMVMETITNHPIVFRTNSSGIESGGNERMRILAGGGITFNGDTAAANALDDYEEGTFTPTAEGGTTAGTTTYNNQFGYYTKVGRMVNVTLLIGWSAMTGTGNLHILGIPFALGNLGTGQNYPVGSIITSDLDYTQGTYCVSFGLANSNIMRVENIGDNITSAPQQCVNEAASLRLTLTYFTA